MSNTLDLGSGPHPRNPFSADEVFGIDIVSFDNPNIKSADLVISPIPFEDNSFDYITGFDFIEHIPRIIYIDGKRKQPFIDLMSEVWRVLKPGGEALFSTPAFPHQEMFQDPQHVNYITENSIRYFCLPSESLGEWSGLFLCQSYGFRGQFEFINQYWRDDVSYHLVWHIRAIK